MDCFQNVQNVQKRSEASTCCQVPASYFANFQHLSIILLQLPARRQDVRLAHGMESMKRS